MFIIDREMIERAEEIDMIINRVSAVLLEVVFDSINKVYGTP
jgi:hypothetical protein